MKNQLLRNQILNLIVSLRPIQWLKNTVVFAAIIFSREFFISTKFYPVLYTFFIFSMSSSAMYLINDIADKASDKLHFSKRYRPVASGKISTPVALVTALLLAIAAATLSLSISKYLFLIIVIYFATQLLYTFWLKKIIILDILIIAFAFMLRVFAGSVVVSTTLSAWLILTTIMLSLFLAIGKRRSEITLMRGLDASKYRYTLLFYPPKLLDGLTFMMATSTLITYSLFTFIAPETTQREFFAAIFPRTLSSPKMLMATIPIVLYGIFRYLYLTFEKSDGESPEKVFLSDKPLFASVLVWFLSVILILYFFSI